MTWPLLLLGLLAAACALSLLGACGQADDPPELIVGVASSLEPLFAELEAPFERAHDAEVTFVIGASGTLARQIEQGAPIDVYVAADTSFMGALSDEGLVEPATVTVFGRGRLAAVASIELPVGAGFAELGLDGRVRHVAIANPELAPYGDAAVDLLQRAGTWDAIEPKVVYGENVAQVLQFVKSGNAEIGYVPVSYVRAGLVDGLRVVELGDPANGPALPQAIGVVKDSRQRQLASLFVDLLAEPKGQAAVQRYGYLPGNGEAD